jgi:hypothetical protein
VHYLTQLLIHFDSITDSFHNLVNFVEDRLRAVQVDLTVAQYASKTIQYSMVRIHILILYILSDCQQYQHAFGRKALHAALSNYWNDHASTHPSSPTGEKEDTTTTTTRDDDDEIIMALSILILLNDQFVRCQQHHHSSAEIIMDQLIFGITDLYRKHAQLERRTRSLPTFLRWTMHLISNILLGHWRMALSMIMGGEIDHLDGDNSGIFLTMARLCMAPSIRYIQWKALQLYNVALMPRERVSGLELARLLYCSSATESVQFAQRYGLPVEDGEDGDCVVILKAEPIQPFGKHVKPAPESDQSVRSIMDQYVLKNDPFRISDDIQIPSMDWMSHLLIHTKIGKSKQLESRDS